MKLPLGDTLTSTATFTVSGALNQFGNSEVFTGNLVNQGTMINAGAAGGDPDNLATATEDASVNTGVIVAWPRTTRPL